jgi:hypothetical protein
MARLSVGRDDAVRPTARLVGSERVDDGEDGFDVGA